MEQGTAVSMRVALCATICWGSASVLSFLHLFGFSQTKLECPIRPLSLGICFIQVSLWGLPPSTISLLHRHCLLWVPAPISLSGSGLLLHEYPRSAVYLSWPISEFYASHLLLYLCLFRVQVSQENLLNAFKKNNIIFLVVVIVVCYCPPFWAAVLLVVSNWK